MKKKKRKKRQEKTMRGKQRLRQEGEIHQINIQTYAANDLIHDIQQQL